MPMILALVGRIWTMLSDRRELLHPRCKLLLLNFTLLIIIPGSLAIFQIPLQFRIAADIEIIGPAKSTSLFSLEEFADSVGGNFHLRVSKLDGSRYGTTDTNRYYRLKDGRHNKEPMDYDDWIVGYSDSQQLCSNARLNEWELKYMSLAINIMIDEENSKGNLKSDRTAIGSGAFLRFVSQNVGIFLHQDRVFDSDLLADMHLFVGHVVSKTKQTLKVVLSMPDYAAKDSDDQEEGMNIRSFELPPSKITLIIIEDDDPNVNMNALELLELMPENLITIKLTYNSVEEYSVSRRLGFGAGSSDFEFNPFSLPPGSGCGSSDNFLYVEATQFSGIFEANGVADSKRYIAYDEPTGHLRIDSINNHKLIYDLSLSLMTFIDISNNETRNICTQSYLAAFDSDDLFSKVRVSKDILGLSDLRGLIYLGRQTLEDGGQCSVFEMKISHNQIPLILAMNMRIELANVHLLSVVYYFVDELSLDPKEGKSFAYENLWLKRIELISRHSLSKYNILNSQVTFSEFTWTLDSVSEDELDREISIRHPVRRFDTLECQAVDQRREIDLMVLARSGSDLGVETPRSLLLSADQVESVEEAAMGLLVKQASLMRSQINELELMLPPDGTSDWSSIHIRATLTDPLLLTIEKALAGWVYSIETITFGNEGRMISTKRMTRLECSMKLATELVAGLKTAAMIYCPNLGCGFMKSLDSFEYMKKESFKDESSWPSLRDNFYMCEVYSQTRDVASSRYETIRLPDLAVEIALNGSMVNIATGTVGPTSFLDESPVFRGIVTRAVVTSGHHRIDSMGKLVRSGYCFTARSKLNTKHSDATTMLVGLKLGTHQSIAFCHKACLLQPNCLSYSYDKNQRTCIMTNVPANRISSMMSEIPLHEDAACSIYTRNPINSYAQVLDISLNSLRGLSSNSPVDFFVAKGDLDDCTSLCHMDELNCRQFYLFPLENLCFLEDRSSVIIGSVFSPQELESYKSRDDKIKLFAHIIGQTIWSGYHKSLLYRQHFDHIFHVKYTSKVKQLDSGTREDEILLKLDLDEGDVRLFRLIARDPIHEMSLEDCLRECAIVQSNCVVADHYLGFLDNVYARICSMYLLELVLNGDKYSSSAKSSIQDTDLIVLDPRTTHYRLTGDNLLPRMMLMVSADVFLNQTTFQGERESLILEESYNGANGKSDSKSDTNHGKIIDKNSSLMATSLVSFMLMVVGAAISLITTLLKNARPRNERSMSEVNLHSEQYEMRIETGSIGELDDLD